MEGFVNLNKPQGLSSHTAMAKVRRLLGCKAGHSGTLDPAADGVLPICLGSSTRLAEFITELPKSYRAEISFGRETTTYDREGEVCAVADASHLTLPDIKRLLPRFTGEIWQVPPMTSALKVNGRPLYALARRGEEIERAPRAVTIYELKIIDSRFAEKEPVIVLDITCSKGTYIRSLAHDMGQAAGVCAFMSALTRTRVGPFKLTDSLTLEELERRFTDGDQSFILPPSFGVAHLPTLTVTEEKTLLRVSHGNEFTVQGLEDMPVCRIEDDQGRLLALGSLDKGLVRINKVLITE